MTDYDFRRQKQREETEGRIIEVAIRLFGKNGYAKTSIKDIAEGAGVANGLVGKYFATKEILLSEAYLHAVTYSYAASEEKINANESMKVLVRQTVEICKNKPEYYLFFKTLMSASDLPQEYTDARRAFFRNSTIYPHIISEQKKGIITNGREYDFFILFMKTVFCMVEMYSNMPLIDDIYIAKKTIQLVMRTIEDCI